MRIERAPPPAPPEPSPPYRAPPPRPRPRPPCCWASKSISYPSSHLFLIYSRGELCFHRLFFLSFSLLLLAFLVLLAKMMLYSFCFVNIERERENRRELGIQERDAMETNQSKRGERRERDTHTLLYSFFGLGFGLASPFFCFASLLLRVGFGFSWEGVSCLLFPIQTSPPPLIK